MKKRNNFYENKKLLNDYFDGLSNKYQDEMLESNAKRDLVLSEDLKKTEKAIKLFKTHEEQYDVPDMDMDNFLRKLNSKISYEEHITISDRIWNFVFGFRQRAALVQRIASVSALALIIGVSMLLFFQSNRNVAPTETNIFIKDIEPQSIHILKKEIEDGNFKLRSENMDDKEKRELKELLEKKEIRISL